MTSTPSWPNPDCPVYVSAVDPRDGRRYVQVLRLDGTISQPHACATQHELERHVAHERADVDLHDPAQVYWVDRPGVWSPVPRG